MIIIPKNKEKIEEEKKIPTAENETKEAFKPKNILNEDLNSNDFQENISLEPLIHPKETGLSNDNNWLENIDEIKEKTNFNFNDFIELDDLGESGFVANTIKAYNKRNMGYVALKRFPKPKNTKESFQEIFVENTLLKKINKIRKKNKDIVSLLRYDGVFINPKDSLPILQTETGFCTLFDVLNAGIYYSAPEIVYVLKELVEGCALLQTKGICNRDINPCNIMLSEETTGKIVHKITNFGVKFMIGKEIRDIPLSSVVSGSAEYSAPEILKKGEMNSYNPYKADVFSLGITAVKMLNNSIGRKDIDVRENYLDSLKELANEDEIKNILKLMLKQNPLERPDFLELKSHIRNISELAREAKDEKKFFGIHLKSKEKIIKEKPNSMIHLFNECRVMSESYLKAHFDLKLAQYYLDKCRSLLSELENKDLKRLKPLFGSFDIEFNQIWCKYSYGDYFLKIENYQEGQKYLDESVNMVTGFAEFEEFKICDLFEKMEESEKKEKNIQAENQKLEKRERNLENLSDLLSIYGFFHEKNGKLTKAEEFYKKALGIRLFSHGKDHNYTLNSYNNLAVLYESMRNFQNAEECYTKALEITLSLFGENSSITANSYNNLGLLYDNMGDFSKAEEFHMKSLEIRVFLFGEEHAETATSYNNLGALYDNMGILNKAEELYKKSLEIRLLILGENHTETAISYNNLGGFHEKTGNLLNAKEFYKKAMKIRVFIYGEHHDATASSYNNLAGIYESMGKLEKAKEFYEKALLIEYDLFGHEDPKTLIVLKNLDLMERN